MPTYTIIISRTVVVSVNTACPVCPVTRHDLGLFGNSLNVHFKENKRDRSIIALLPYNVGILVVVDTISAVLCENCCIYDSNKSLAILKFMFTSG